MSVLHRSVLIGSLAFGATGVQAQEKPAADYVNIYANAKAERMRELAPAPGWKIEQTKNFRVWHPHSQEAGREMAHVLEKARDELHQKWLNAKAPPWEQRCDVFVHATSAQVNAVAKLPGTLRGVFTSRTNQSWQVSWRCIDVLNQERALIDKTLRHEANHAVLDRALDGYTMPIWANEGAAMVSEGHENVQRQRNVISGLKKDSLFSVHQLLTMNKYPTEQEKIDAFYAQSTLLTDYFCQKKPSDVFIKFIRDSFRHGYGHSAHSHYGIRSPESFSAAWEEKPKPYPVTTRRRWK